MPPSPAAPPPGAGPGLPGEPAARRGNPVGLAALIVGVIALVLAFVPVVSFFAGLPALAAIILGIVGLVLAGRRRGLATAGLIIGAVALIAAIVVSTVTFVGFVRSRITDLPQASDFPSGFPSQFPSDEPSGGSGGAALAPGRHTIVYRVTGSGTASITYSTFANGRMATARDARVALPRVRTQQLTVTSGGTQQFVLAAIDLNGSEPLGCSIEVDGTVVTTNRSGSSSGVELVTCSTNGG